MSKLKHTPGPWQVSGGRSRVDAYGHMVGPDGLSIACVFYSDQTNADHIASLADARLIAQAWKIPDLEAEIEQLTAENERLREALQTADETLIEVNLSNYGMDDVDRLNNSSIEASQIIRAALQYKEGK